MQAKHQLETYWDQTDDSYSHYPSVRHRKLFVINVIRKLNLPPDARLFDYGCGNGDIIKSLQQLLPGRKYGGFDLSLDAIRRARKRTNLQGELISCLTPKLQDPVDVIVCSEVIEHTTDYQKCIDWFRNNLKTNGIVILTTQSGKVHKSDLYAGHTQHFNIRDLCNELNGKQFRIISSQLSGFPFLTLQKYLTDVLFDHTRTEYLEGPMSFKKRLVFECANIAFHLQRPIKFGPQIYIVARKTGN